MNEIDKSLSENGYAVDRETPIENWREAFGGIFPAKFSRLMSPVVQAPDLGFRDSYGWQNAVWDALWRPGAMVAVRTCAESGKSSRLIPALHCAWACAFPGSQSVITSASVDQIEQQLWPSLQAVARRMRWKATARCITLPGVDGLPGSTITIRVTNQGERFEGYHSRVYPDDAGNSRFCPLLITVDEAKQVPHEIFMAVEQCNPVVTFYASTCGDDTGDFYEACMNKNGLWQISHEWLGEKYDFQIDWLQCPHLMVGNTRRRKEALLEQYGEDSPEVCSILAAKFYRSGTWSVFNDADMARVRHSMSGMVPQIGGGRRVFCDFAAGGDELTFGLRDGNLIHSIVGWRNTNTASPTDTASKYIKLFQQHKLKANEIYADNGGVGQLIISQMHEMGWPINRVNVNKDPVYKAGYVDRYTELHWKFKDLLEKGMLILPHDAELLDQMRKRRFVRKNSDGAKIAMEPKEKARKDRKEHSPDRLDTVVHLCDGLEPQIALAKKDLRLRTGTTEEYFDRMREQRESGVGESEFGGGWGGDNFS